MAKKRGRKSRNQFGDAAETFGAVLGVLTSKVAAVNQQRDAVSKEILGFLHGAASMLAELGHTDTLELPKGRHLKSLLSVAKGKPGRKRGYKVTRAARKKMSLAAKRRWAARRVGKGN